MSEINQAVWERAEELAAQEWEYSVVKEELSDGSPVYLARNLELPGCLAQGDTPEEALVELKEATCVYLAASLHHPAAHHHPGQRRQKRYAYFTNQQMLMSVAIMSMCHKVKIQKLGRAKWNPIQLNHYEYLPISPLQY